MPGPCDDCSTFDFSCTGKCKTVKQQALQELADALDALLVAQETIPERAKMFAAINPMGFYVWTGTTLPPYLEQVEKVIKQTREARVKLQERIDAGGE